MTDTKKQHKRPLPVTILKYSLLTMLGLVLLLCAGLGGLYAYSSSESGQKKIAELLLPTVNSALQAQGLRLDIEKLGLNLPFKFEPAGISLYDEQGLWLELGAAHLHISKSGLLRGRVRLDTLSVNHARLHRLPVLPPAPEKPEVPGPSIPELADPERYFNIWPSRLLSFEIADLRLEDVGLPKALLGIDEGADPFLLVSLLGTAKANSSALDLNLDLTRHDLPNADAANLTAHISRRGDSRIALRFQENEQGLALGFIPLDALREFRPASAEAALLSSFATLQQDPANDPLAGLNLRQALQELPPNEPGLRQALALPGGLLLQFQATGKLPSLSGELELTLPASPLAKNDDNKNLLSFQAEIGLEPKGKSLAATVQARLSDWRLRQETLSGEIRLQAQLPDLLTPAQANGLLEVDLLTDPALLELSGLPALPTGSEALPLALRSSWAFGLQEDKLTFSLADFSLRGSGLDMTSRSLQSEIPLAEKSAGAEAAPSPADEVAQLLSKLVLKGDLGLNVTDWTLLSALSGLQLDSSLFSLMLHLDLPDQGKPLQVLAKAADFTVLLPAGEAPQEGESAPEQRFGLVKLELDAQAGNLADTADLALNLHLDGLHGPGLGLQSLDLNAASQLEALLQAAPSGTLSLSLNAAGAGADAYSLEGVQAELTATLAAGAQAPLHSLQGNVLARGVQGPDLALPLLQAELAAEAGQALRLTASGQDFNFQDFQLTDFKLQAASVLGGENGLLPVGEAKADIQAGPFSGPDLQLESLQAQARLEAGKDLEVTAQGQNAQVQDFRLPLFQLKAGTGLGGENGYMPAGAITAELKAGPFSGPDLLLRDINAQARAEQNGPATLDFKAASIKASGFALDNISASARGSLGGESGFIPVGKIRAEAAAGPASGPDMALSKFSALLEGEIGGKISLSADSGTVKAFGYELAAASLLANTSLGGANGLIPSGPLQAEVLAGPLNGPDIGLKSLSGTLSAEMVDALPEQIKADINAKELRVPQLNIAELQANAEGALSGPLRLQVQGNGDLRAEADATWSPGALSLDKLELDARIDPENMLPLPLNSKKGQAVGLKLARPAALTYSEQGFSASGLDVALLPAGQLSLDGALSAASYNLQATLSGLDLSLFRALVPGMPNGLAQAEVKLNGSPARPDGDFRLAVSQLQMPGTNVPPLALAVNGTLVPASGGAELQAVLDVDEKSRQALGLSQAEATLSLPLAFDASGIPSPAQNRPIMANLALDGDLSTMWGLLPMADRRLLGKTSLRASLDGSLQKPRLSLDADISNATYEDLVLGVLLKDINASAGMARSGDLLGDVVFKLSASDGMGGTVSIDGGLNAASMEFDVNGSLDDLKPLRRQDLRVSLSGTAKAVGSPSNPVIQADIIVNEGDLRLANLPGSGIRTLEISESRNAPPPPKSSGDGGSLDVNVSIPNRFFVRGYGVDMEWRGNVNASGALSRPEVVGSLEAVRGTMDFLNRNFSLDHGIVTLDGGWPVNPRLDILLNYQAENIIAGIEVNGTANKPGLELTSQPELPQDEILSQILFGESVQKIGRLEAIQLASAAASLAGFGASGGVLGMGRQVLGVDVLRLNSSSGGGEGEDEGMLSSSSLEMGKYVSDKVYVGVQQGMAADSTGVVVEVELTPSVNLKANASGDNTEVGLRWQRNY